MWARRLHVYVSMALLLVVLFFSITGITLNRPQWFELSEPVREQHSAMLNMDSFQFTHERGFSPSREPLLDALSRQFDLRGTPSQLDVYTEVEAGELVLGEISLDYKGPGYNATVFIDMTTGNAEVETTDYGLVALLNDLHKGRNSGEVWKWFIDITALLMVGFVMTGVCILLPKKKTLRTSLKWTAFGSLLTLLIYWIAVP